MNCRGLRPPSDPTEHVMEAVVCVAFSSFLDAQTLSQNHNSPRSMFLGASIAVLQMVRRVTMLHWGTSKTLERK